LCGARILNGCSCPLHGCLLDLNVCSGNHQCRPGFVCAGNKDVLIKACERLRGFHRIVEIDENVRDTARELRADIDGNHRLGNCR